MSEQTIIHSFLSPSQPSQSRLVSYAGSRGSDNIWRDQKLTVWLSPLDLGMSPPKLNKLNMSRAGSRVLYLMKTSTDASFYRKTFYICDGAVDFITETVNFMIAFLSDSSKLITINTPTGCSTQLCDIVIQVKFLNRGLKIMELKRNKLRDSGIEDYYISGYTVCSSKFLSLGFNVNR